MIKVLVYGAGRSFQQSVNILKNLESIRDIEVIAVVSEDKYCPLIFGWNFVNKNQIKTLTYDCIYLAINDGIDAAKRELSYITNSLDIVVPREAIFIPSFSFTNYMRLRQEKLTIIANMCWGGVTYHYFHLQFLSPFINMFILDDDYLNMLRNLDKYLQSPLVFSHMEEEHNMKTEYPVFCLGAELPHGRVFLHMNHYKSVKDGETKWSTRKGRMNMDNLLVMMYTEDSKSAEAFEELPFTKKVCFTNFPSELPSSCCLDIFSRPSLKGLPSWQIVSGLAAGRYVFYNPWELLLNGNHKARWSIL